MLYTSISSLQLTSSNVHLGRSLSCHSSENCQKCLHYGVKVLFCSSKQNFDSCHLNDRLDHMSNTLLKLDIV